MLYKQVGNLLVVLIKVHSSGPDIDKPVLSIEKNDRFFFYMTLNTPKFITVTNLDNDLLGESQLFYFSNLYQNDLDTTFNLTQKIQAPVGVVNYKPGDLSSDGTNTFECIKNTSSAPPGAAFWHNRGNKQYVSARDMILFSSKIRNYITSADATSFTIRAFGLNTGTGAYDKEIFLKNNTVTTDTMTRTIQANLSDLPQGRYKIQVNADVFDLYIDDEAIYNGAFGIIDIFSYHADGPGFGFFDINGKVKDTVSGISGQWLRYKVRFANRMAYWKYLTLKHGVLTISDDPNYVFNATPGGNVPQDYFTSAKPIPLTEAPLSFKFTVKNIAFAEPPLVPNPDPNITGILSRTLPDKDYYCTIPLNY
jgi:hypothetical protein